MSNQSNNAAPPTSGPGSSDEQQLEKYGYKQELSRELNIWTNWAVGFAFISPVVGLYTVVELGAQTSGAAWVWALPIVMLGQLLVAGVYTSLAARWPLCGGIYQWSRRLIGGKYGWWAGWFYIWALVLTLSTVAYGGGFFLGELIGYEPETTWDRIMLALIVMAIFTAVNVVGLHLLRWVVNIGIAAEAVASVGIAVALIGFFREQPLSALVTVDMSLFPAGTEFFPAFLATVAIAGWVILGFDSCGSIAEETRSPRRDVPRAIVWSVLTVGLVEVLAGMALMLATPDIGAVIRGEVSDPVSHAVSSALGEWAAIPFLLVVVIGFIACGIAVQATGVRAVYALARDGALPFSGVWSKVSPRSGSPVAATLLVAALSSLAFLYANVLNVLVAFATGAYYVCFLAPVAALLYVRLRGHWTRTEGIYKWGAFGTAINVAAAAWLVFEIINIAWPRYTELPWYQNWAFVVGTAIFGVVGLVYFLTHRPDRRLSADPDGDDDGSATEMNSSVAPGVSSSS